jgi:hypothetical protein
MPENKTKSIKKKNARTLNMQDEELFKRLDIAFAKVSSSKATLAGKVRRAVDEWCKSLDK